MTNIDQIRNLVKGGGANIALAEQLFSMLTLSELEAYKGGSFWALRLELALIVLSDELTLKVDAVKKHLTMVSKRAFDIHLEIEFNEEPWMWEHDTIRSVIEFTAIDYAGGKKFIKRLVNTNTNIFGRHSNRLIWFEFILEDKGSHLFDFVLSKKTTAADKQYFTLLKTKQKQYFKHLKPNKK